MFISEGYEQYNLGVSSNGITIIPDFVKTSPSVLVKEPSSGAFIDVPANSLQLTKNRNILQRYLYIRRSLCRLIRLLSTWRRAAAFFSASGAALSQEVPTVK
jgi:hypothetical protein